MGRTAHLKIFGSGLIAVIALVFIYFGVVSPLSGWEFASAQWEQYGFYLGALVLGFGIQVMLFTYLRELIRNSEKQMGGGTVAMTGTTSTFAMLSCCAHYLANIVPILGVTGLVTIVSEYQVKIFWLGIALNIFGIIFISNRIRAFRKHADEAT